MKGISGTYIVFHCKLEDFAKGINGVLSAYRITFVVPNMIVSG